MAYNIEPKSTREFINMDTNFPRFQRKQTWGAKDNFKLCVSVFKNYPMGVIIINKNREGYWLLDGRQRLNALTKLSNNPLEVYGWAKKFVGFKTSTDEIDLRKMYWEKIREYLQENFEENVYKPKDENSENTKSSDNDNESDDEIDQDDVNEDVFVDGTDENSFDESDQIQGLNCLLDLILMVHSTSSRSKWEKLFDYSRYIGNLKYMNKIVDGNKKFSPEELVKTMKDILSEQNKSQKDIVDFDSYINYFTKDRYIVPEDKIDSFKTLVQQTWEETKKCFQVILDLDRNLEESRVGLIIITAGTDLDAQNIFSLVNSGGTKLTAEEILSAKPYWNKPVNNPSEKTKAAVKELYEKLKIQLPKDTVRWDLCATLIPRLNKDKIVFSKSASDDKLSAVETTLGFKLVSALYNNGISSTHVSSIEKTDKINWETDYETLVDDLNNLCDLLSQHKYFKCMNRWGQTIMSLLSNTIALEFITIMYNRWSNIGKSVVDSAETKQLKREAVSLMDKLVYEYSTRAWRGSSDSKLAKDVQDTDSRVKPKTKEEWIGLLENLAKGKIDDAVVTQQIVKPILFHLKFLSEDYPSVNDPENKYDIDHIYPQALFKGNNSIEKQMKDSIINLEILSSTANKSKNDNELTKITDASIIDEITKSSGIKEKDFRKFSDLSNINELKELRNKMFKNIVESKRESMLTN